MKEIEVDCPCCDARLLIDVRTRAVLRHTPKAELDEFGKPGGTAAWDRAQARVTEREGRGTDAFDDALALEQSREKKYDDLFEKAKAKVDDKKKQVEDEGRDA